MSLQIYMILKLVIHCFSDIFPFGVLQIYMVLKLLHRLRSLHRTFGVLQIYMALKPSTARTNWFFAFGVLQIYMVLKPLDLLESPINLLWYYKFTWFSNYSGMFINIFHLFGYYKFTWFSNSTLVIGFFLILFKSTILHSSQTGSESEYCEISF